MIFAAPLPGARKSFAFSFKIEDFKFAILRPRNSMRRSAPPPWAHFKLDVLKSTAVKDHLNCGTGPADLSDVFNSMESVSRVIESGRVYECLLQLRSLDAFRSVLPRTEGVHERTLTLHVA